MSRLSLLQDQEKQEKKQIITMRYAYHRLASQRYSWSCAFLLFALIDRSLLHSLEHRHTTSPTMPHQPRLSLIDWGQAVTEAAVLRVTQSFDLATRFYIQPNAPRQYTREDLQVSLSTMMSTERTIESQCIAEAALTQEKHSCRTLVQTR
ncbi:hypothetical protein H0G86_010777 [Trichoderma simmonsii]|uniref:Uncharacterized protein n=1 Tax=Trichoderma simmonsii TaxID=1491479 RepID=A0A8G0LM41_9HYPO|nr:hypothetical protein H0G86_010777 [Trichoderma simmonsii]